ncbi:MAG: STAS domain-containing protein [Acidobacteriota bacterium]
MREISLWSGGRKRERPPLETRISACGSYRMVSVRGRLVLDNAPELLAELRQALNRADTARLKIDLRDVEYIDSSGISVLIQGLKLAQQKSIDYVLLDPSPKVQAVLDLSQLDDFFTIEKTSVFDDEAETLIFEVAGRRHDGAE